MIIVHVQVNGTDLHVCVERLYLDLGMIDFHRQGQWFTSRCPTRSREHMVRDTVQIWSKTDVHLAASHGDRPNGMRSALKKRVHV